MLSHKTITVDLFFHYFLRYLNQEGLYEIVLSEWKKPIILTTTHFVGMESLRGSKSVIVDSITLVVMTHAAMQQKLIRSISIVTKQLSPAVEDGK